MAPDAPAFGPVTINRLIRLASLTLAVWQSRTMNPRPGYIVERAAEFEGFIRDGRVEVVPSEAKACTGPTCVCGAEPGKCAQGFGR